MRRIFRQTTEKKASVDLVIVAPVHQGVESVSSLVQNVEKYVKGKVALILHYNNDEFLDENTLPPFVWLVRKDIKTQHGTKSIGMAVAKCIEFAVKHFEFLNLMTFSLGSMFYRDFVPPSYPKVALSAPEQLLNNCRLLHTSPISMDHLGYGAKYLEVQGSPGWQYARGFDSDHEVHIMMRNRNFRWTRGSQFSGQIFPYEVAEQIAEDQWFISDNIWYCLEEMWFSTYAYNYAVEKGITVEQMETIIDWEGGYGVTKEMVVKYRSIARVLKGIGHAVCKVSDPRVREFINAGYTE
uniref:Glycosyltransferase n=1 Tax=viral metagenome TaxID=1070528 RepID=A0A6C0J579_9ZZZZ